MAGCDVRASTRTSAGAATSDRTRIKGISVVTAVGSPNLVLNDGNGGAELLNIAFAGAAAATQYVEIPGDGILASTGIYVTTMTNISSVTVFYG